jgi:S1-C subfamily serine protease
MNPRTALSIALAATAAAGAFALGSYSAQQMAARQVIENQVNVAALQAELARTLAAVREAQEVTGTSGRLVAGEDTRGVVDAIKQELQQEMGLFPVQVIKERRKSFVELYTYDDRGASSYGTAGYLGGGYFITVKHGVMALAPEQGDAVAPRRVVAIKLLHEGRLIDATVVDSGDAQVEVDPGDWAILQAAVPVDLPPLAVRVGFGFEFGDPLVRLGNDYSKGIIASTGYAGQRTPGGLVTCLTDGHPGVSGGGVLEPGGMLVGISIGRMQGDYRFSFILPLRPEMFRRVPGLAAQGSTGSEIALTISAASDEP